MYFQKFLLIVGLVAVPAFARSVVPDNSVMVDASVAQSKTNTAPSEASVAQSKTRTAPSEASDSQAGIQDQLQVINYLANHEAESRKLLGKYLDQMSQMKPADIKRSLMLANVPEKEAALIAKNPSLLKEKRNEIIDSSLKAIKEFAKEMNQEMAKMKSSSNVKQPSLQGGNPISVSV